MNKSGIDPDLEGIQSEIIQKARLIYEDRPSLIYYHETRRDIPVSSNSDIRFSQLFSEKAFGKDAPKIISLVICALVESTRFKHANVTEIADRVFERIASGCSHLEGIEGLSDLIGSLSREFQKIEINDLGDYQSNIPSTYRLKIHKESGHLIGTSSIIDKLIQTEPVFEFIKDGFGEDALGKLTILPEKSSFVVIAYKKELLDHEKTKTLLKTTKTVEAPFESIFKLPLRGHHSYEEMYVVSISPQMINETREGLGLKPFTEPLNIPFAYLPAYGASEIRSLEEYMNLPGLEKYRDIISAIL